MSKKVFKSGFVGLAGRANVGKSTLVNKILKQKVVITSDKIQTTRSRINCIYTTDDLQAIFVDCPGFFKPRNLLGEKLNNIIYRMLGDVDLITVMVDIASGIGTGDYFVFEAVKNKPQPKILLLNKIDLISDSRLSYENKKLKSFNFFSDIIAVSAKTGKNIDKYLNVISDKLPPGPKYFPEDMITDQPLRKVAAEIVREKIFKNVSEELPHSVNVEVEDFKEDKTKSGQSLIRINCNIFTERESQKAIIIGKKGRMLKKVGSEARIELENLTGEKVFLELWVKVKKNWTRKEQYLSEFGY